MSPTFSLFSVVHACSLFGCVSLLLQVGCQLRSEYFWARYPRTWDVLPRTWGFHGEENRGVGQNAVASSIVSLTSLFSPSILSSSFSSSTFSLQLFLHTSLLLDRTLGFDRCVPVLLKATQLLLLTCLSPSPFQMTSSRYSWGWHGAKIVALLNCVACVSSSCSIQTTVSTETNFLFFRTDRVVFDQHNRRFPGSSSRRRRQDLSRCWSCRDCCHNS